MDATQAVNHVWEHLLKLEDEALRCANVHSIEKMITERTAGLASAALRYAAAHLEAQQEGNESARVLRRWADDVGSLSEGSR